MKTLVAATLIMLAPALAYAHRPFDSRLTTRRLELPRVHTGGGGAGGVTQPPEPYNPPKQTATAPKAAASHGS
jgi:hypothetical protein